MAARPIAAYKKMAIMINGVMKNVIIPVRSPASRENQKATSQSNDDDECFITEVEASGTVDLSGNSAVLSQQSDIHLDLLDMEPVEISPCDNAPDCDITDLTISPEKLVASSSEMPLPAENNVTDTHNTIDALSSPRSTRSIIIPASLSCTASNGTVETAEALVLSETQPTPFPSATVVQNIVANTSQVDNAEYGLQSLCSQSVTSASSSADPVLIAPSPGTKVSQLSYISSPRTMTKEEAIAAGWFTEDPVVENNFVSSVELVSLETENVINGISTSLALGIGNHEDIIPVMSRDEELQDSNASTLMGVSGSSVYPLLGEHQLQMDVTTDRKAHLIANETKWCHKLENLVHDDCNDDGYSYGRLMSEEDEPLTAVMEGLDNENVMHGASANSNAVNSENTATVRRRRGRPPKLRTVKNANRIKRTEGHTAGKQYHFKDCGVWLQQLRLLSATVNIRRVRKYLCCHELIPSVKGSCGLCHGRRISESVIELAVARMFRSGSHQCAKAKKVWHEFSFDPHLLLPSASSESKKTPSKTEPMSDSGPSSQENKKYLLIQTETGTFVVPVESAVGCIVSEQEIAQMLSSQAVSSSTSYAGEFSNETLLAVCSQMEQSSSHKTASTNDKTLSDAAWNTSASATHLRSVANTGTVNRISKTRRLSVDLVCRARRSFRGRSLKREMHALGIRGRSPRQQSKPRCRRVR